MSGEIAHYTTLGAFEGILKSKCLWSSHYKCMNDPKELDHLDDNLEALIELAFKRGPELTRNVAEIKRAFLFHKNNLKHVFISCFSDHESSQLTSAFDKKNGLLSQWRNYSEMDGVALCFEDEDIEKTIKLNPASKDIETQRLNPVIYADIGWDSTHLDLMTRFIKATVNDDEAPIDQDIVEFGSAFLKEALHSKSSAFRDEREVRIVTTLPNNNLIKMRGENKNKIPYIEILKTNDLLPISRVMVGPGNQQARTHYIIHHLLAENGYENIPVEVSSIEIS